MPLILASGSHLDHGLTEAQMNYIMEKYQDRDGFFIDTFELPKELGSVPCGLHGPATGDEPVLDSECRMEIRGSRPWHSRVCDRPTRPTQTMTVIAGPHDSHPCVLYTAFGGPLAPREPGDPACDKAESEAFWAEHALSF